MVEQYAVAEAEIQVVDDEHAVFCGARAGSARGGMPLFCAEGFEPTKKAANRL
jgi:hypothetical protein